MTTEELANQLQKDVQEDEEFMELLNALAVYTGEPKQDAQIEFSSNPPNVHVEAKLTGPLMDITLILEVKDKL